MIKKRLTSLVGWNKDRPVPTRQIVQPIARDIAVLLNLLKGTRERSVAGAVQEGEVVLEEGAASITPTSVLRLSGESQTRDERKSDGEG